MEHKKETELNCNFCTKTITVEVEVTVKCFVCDSTYHHCCTELDGPLQKYCFYQCHVCRKAKLFEKYGSIRNEFCSLQLELKKVKEEKVELEKDVLRRVQEKFEKKYGSHSTEGELCNKNKQEVAMSKLQNCVRDLQERLRSMKKENEQLREELNNVKEQKRRRQNLIIFGVPETNSKPMELHKMDTVKLVKLATSLGVPDLKVRRIVRLGTVKRQPAEKGNSTNRPRPLLINIPDEDSRKILLKSAKNLRNMEKWKTVFIKPDLTPTQQEQEKRLWTELKSRRAMGERVKIMYGKVTAVL